MFILSSRARFALIFTCVILVLLILLPKETITQTYRSYYGSLHEFDSSNDSAILPTRANAVILMLIAPSRIHQATLALLNVENRFNRRLQYPYVLFTASEEESAMINEEERRKIDWITQGRAKFAVVTKESWDVPDFYDKARVEDSFRNIGFSSGYRSMCRFYSGFFWKHPALAQYDWLWRLDTDIEFHCDIPYDPVARMIDAGALYGFVQINEDAVWVQPSLAGNVSEFLFNYYSSHSSPSGLVATGAGLPPVPTDVNHAFVWNSELGIEKALKGEAGSEEWTRMCMYNNFEISHRSVWESEIYTSLFYHLDNAGGFFYERWSDSPIHSFGIAMALRKDQVMQFHDMGYQHQGWAYECAQLDRCTCLREGVAADFDDQGYKWFNVSTA
ncbi:glycosyltransferase family 15 protein [Collybiopsis luxurians FD-317 M1]|uniref:Glycosyltransferase family 15 protein n=1 Tax=Collybiopsis luxurians FD-317 M1 TaxID=944289 RepID=A0A0D0CUU5_9AGAR|nr:glycosyltransferase family 15 protein [Collybiopsis luxurians FD-317 M1]